VRLGCQILNVVSTGGVNFEVKNKTGHKSQVVDQRGLTWPAGLVKRVWKGFTSGARHIITKGLTIPTRDDQSRNINTVGETDNGVLPGFVLVPWYHHVGQLFIHPLLISCCEFQ
jgi:hypothetical protein